MCLLIQKICLKRRIYPEQIPRMTVIDCWQHVFSAELAALDFFGITFQSVSAYFFECISCSAWHFMFPFSEKKFSFKSIQDFPFISSLNRRDRRIPS